jgi:hypothetical protein
MKRIIFCALACLTAIYLYAADPVKVTPTAEPVATETAPVLEAPQGKNIFEGSVSKINFDIKSAYQDDGAGQIYTNELSIKAMQTLYKNFTADVFIRFIKPMSNENTPVITELLQAKFQYVNNFFQIVAGRAELTKTISTLNYFGPYSTAGQRYLDLVGFTIPFFLKAGVPELQEIDLPPLAFSMYYFPTMLNLTNTTYNGYQEYYLTQVRANARLWDNPFQFIFNLGKGTTEYFMYSILSGKVVVDTSASIDLFNHYKINASYGILNTDKTNQTSVMAAGLELHDFREWIFVINDIIFELQMPLGNSAGDFQPQDLPWFIVLRNKMGNFRYGLAATTAANDYTFKNIVSYVPGFAGPFGSGNVYAPEGLSFTQKSGLGTSWYGYIAYEF